MAMVTASKLIDPRQLGISAMNMVLSVQGCLHLLAYCIKHVKELRKLPVRAVFYKQIYFTGIQALGSILFLGSLYGFIIVGLISSFAGAKVDLTGKILVWAMVRELAPLMAAFIAIARSAGAVATELGSMKIAKELDSLTLMGISPLDYLIVPRIAAITLSVAVVTFYFIVFSVVGGLALAYFVLDIPLLQHLREVGNSLKVYELLTALAKGILFGLALAVVSTYRGLTMPPFMTDIPRVSSRAVMESLFAVFLLDIAIDVAVFSW